MATVPLAWDRRVDINPHAMEAHVKRIERITGCAFLNEGSDIRGFSNREMLYSKVQHE